MTASLRSRRCLAAAALAAVALLAAPVPVSAQTKSAKPRKPPKWTFEVLGVYAFAPSAPDGTAATQFPAGTPFTTEVGLPSRANPSWYFGDGAALFNQVAAQFGSQFGVQVPRITPLDAMLGAAARKDAAGRGFGARITRELTSRLALEVGFEHSQADASLTDEARSAIEASRASFETAFNGLLSTVPQTGLQVTSTASIPGGEAASRTVITGAVNLTVLRSSRVAAHVTAGIGRSATSGGNLDVRLVGNYHFRLIDLSPINETDNVTIRLRDSRSEVIGVFGGGFTYDVGARHGLRADLRVHTGRPGQTTTIDASPAVVAITPSIGLPSITNPSIQFTNTTALRSSLSGSIASQETFTASGSKPRPQLTVSYFVRF